MRFNDRGFSDPFYSQQMSDGTLKIFAYLLLLKDPYPPPFFLTTHQPYLKIKAAKQAVSKGLIILLDDQEESIISDALELGYEVENELIDILSDLLSRTKSEDYAGTRPPQKSYEREIKGLELFAFRINSNLPGCKVYYKFSIQGNELWLVSLHKDRKTDGRT